jgi:hypothetical protein
MSEKALRLLYWAPRILTILLAVFVSLFALDVFGEGYGFLETLVALFMHLIPTFLILLALLVAWRVEWVGGILFLFVAAGFVALSGGRHLGVWLSMVLPSCLIAALFFLGWHHREAIRGTA